MVVDWFFIRNVQAPGFIVNGIAVSGLYEHPALLESWVILYFDELPEARG